MYVIQMITLIVYFIISVHAGISSINHINIDSVPVFYRYVAVTQDHTVITGPAPYFSMALEVFLEPLDQRPNTNFLLFHSLNLNSKVYSNGKEWCCTQTAFDKGLCNSVGSFNVKDVKNWTKIGNKYEIDETGTIVQWTGLDYIYETGENTLRIDEKITLNNTGVWYFFIAQCNTSHTAKVNGILEWRNPYGYLSGVLFPFLPMYICLAIAFLGLLSIWVFFLIKYKENLMGLQHVITATIVIALLENILWSYDYISYNTAGVISDPINMIGALLTSGKLTCVRTLILLVAIGYSITIPELERNTKIYITVLTVVYAIANTIEEYVWVIKTMALDFPLWLEIVTGLVLIITNFIYIGWVGWSLYHQYKTLTEDRQTQKLSMYKKFISFLVGFLVVSGILYFFQMAFLFMNLRDEHWEIWWIWDAYWECGYFLLVLLIAVLWWPNENNERYAYSLQLQSEDGNEELGELAENSDDSPQVQPLDTEKEQNSGSE